MIFNMFHKIVVANVPMVSRQAMGGLLLVQFLLLLVVLSSAAASTAESVPMVCEIASIDIASDV